MSKRQVRRLSRGPLEELTVWRRLSSSGKLKTLCRVITRHGSRRQGFEPLNQGARALSVQVFCTSPWPRLARPRATGPGYEQIQTSPPVRQHRLVPLQPVRSSFSCARVGLLSYTNKSSFRRGHVKDLCYPTGLGPRPATAGYRSQAASGYSEEACRE